MLIGRHKKRSCVYLMGFVNLKSISALLYNKGHNLLTSTFPPKMLN